MDIYNATCNCWTQYPQGLGQSRYYFAAASLSSGLLLFAGGFTGETNVLALGQPQHAGRMSYQSVVGISLSPCMLTATPTDVGIIVVFDGFFSYAVPGVFYSSFVDMYNSTSHQWIVNSAGLGQPRGYLAAASLASGLVLFAGGLASGVVFCI